MTPPFSHAYAPAVPSMASQADGPEQGMRQPQWGDSLPGTPCSPTGEGAAAGAQGTPDPPAGYASSTPAMDTPKTKQLRCMQAKAEQLEQVRQ